MKFFLASSKSTGVEEMKIKEKQEEGSVESSSTEIVNNLLEQEKEGFENFTFQEPNLKLKGKFFFKVSLFFKKTSRHFKLRGVQKC